MPVSHWLARWAVRSADDKILEPSCGNGNLAVAAASRLVDLGINPGDLRRHLSAIELSSVEANNARIRLGELVIADVDEVVQADDFFGWWERHVRDASDSERYDAVIGNPPFIRYQNFPRAGTYSRYGFDVRGRS